MTNHMKTKFIGIAVAALALAASAYANAIFGIGSNSSIPNQVIVNVPPRDQVSNMLVGAVSNRPDVSVLYTSQSNLLMATSGGAAGLTAVGGFIHDVKVAPIAFGFTHIQINPTGLRMINNITITAVTCSLGEAGPLPASCTDPDESQLTNFGSSLNGNNRVAVVAPNGEVITSVTIDSPLGFNTLDQLRVSSGANAIVPILPPDEVVPEPTSMLLLGSGLLVLTQVLRRKLKLGFWTRSA